MIYLIYNKEIEFTSTQHGRIPKEVQVCVRTFQDVLLRVPVSSPPRNKLKENHRTAQKTTRQRCILT